LQLFKSRHTPESCGEKVLEEFAMTDLTGQPVNGFSYCLKLQHRNSPCQLYLVCKSQLALFELKSYFITRIALSSQLKGMMSVPGAFRTSRKVSPERKSLNQSLACDLDCEFE